MNYGINKYNALWQQWFSLSRRRQYLILLMISLAALYFPCSDWLLSRHSLSLLQQELQQKQAEFEHQTKLNIAMKGNTQEYVLTPELTARLAPINQRIRELTADLSVQLSQWYFHKKPTLTLQLSGGFNEIRFFITALLRQFPELSVLAIHLHKPTERQNGEPIDSVMEFQVNLNKEEA
ncbi:hypothetical protein RYD26_11655 [Pasteurellaceae bacterium LIM206]|nr:hypothetical protein [Pasteurellaceae bacterium LIM206]